MLVNIETKETISEEDFRKLFKDISFPVVIKEETLRKFGHAHLHTPDKPLAGLHQEVVEDGVEEVDGRWSVRWILVNKSHDELVTNHPRIAEIKKQLDALDLRSIRPLRALVLRKGDQKDYDVLAGIDKERDALIKEMDVIREAIKMVTSGI